MLATIRGVRESSGEVPFQERQGVHCHQASFCLALAYTNACSILEPIRGPLCASSHTSLCASRCHGSAKAAVAITDVGRSVEPWRARVSPAAEAGAGEFRRRRRTPPWCCQSSVQASRAAGAATSAAARAVQRDPRQRKFARSCSRWLPRFRIGDARVGPRSARPAGGSIRRPTLRGTLFLVRTEAPSPPFERCPGDAGCHAHRGGGRGARGALRPPRPDLLRAQVWVLRCLTQGGMLGRLNPIRNRDSDIRTSE